MKRIAFVTFILAVFTVFISCKKNQLGGTSVIKGKVAHHGRAIPNATVYIKFRAKEFPGTTVSTYDASVKADTEGNYSISCYKGDYYLYGVGFDASIQESVTGGVPVHVRTNETVEIDVAVTE